MNKTNLLKTIGPGLLWAGAAIGVSHLVQSTRAGASFGFYFIWILIIANIIKYPFFEFAPRYAASTGKSLIEGYKKIGKWAIVLYALLTISTMFAIQAAVTVVTAGLVGSVFNISLSASSISAIILVITMIILIIGKFSILDKLIKIIIITLAVTTVLAVVNGLFSGYSPSQEFAVNFDWTDSLNLAFLIAFIGWMPAPLDISVWHSFWTIAKKRTTGYSPSLKEALLDFNIGYIGTIILALGFLALGALFMYGTGEEFSSSASVFAGQLINMFTRSIGSWAYAIIAIAALTTMFSTTLTCLDAYSRVLPTTTKLIFSDNNDELKETSRKSILFWMILLVSGSLILLIFFTEDMKFMVDLATTISFVTAPILAILNYLVVTNKHVPEEARPKPWLRIYAWVGIVFLTGFSIFFIFWRVVL